MIADKKLIALSVCTSKDKARPALKCIHVKGNEAEATNGHIMAKTRFTEFNDDDYPQAPGEPINGDSVFVTPEQVKKAFSGCPKKPMLPILGNVKIAIDREKKKSVVVGTDIDTTVTSVSSNDVWPYPATDEVYPIYIRPETKITCLRLEALEKLCTLMKASGMSDPDVTLQLMRRDGAVKFIIGDGNGSYSFKGLLMPARSGEYDNERLEELERPWMERNGM